MARPENDPVNDQTKSWQRGHETDASMSADDRRKLLEAVQLTIRWGEAFQRSLEDGTLVLNRFSVKKKLGEGGFGKVFLVCDQLEGSPAFGQDIAIKLLSLSGDRISREEISFAKAPVRWFETQLLRIENWLDEIRRHQGLTEKDRAGLVPVLESAMPESKELTDILEYLEQQPIWFTMPVLKQTLKDFVVEQGGKPSPFDARRILLSVADTLQQLHDFQPDAQRDQEIVHRDLKPGNILMDEAGKPFVADFGLAIGRFDQLFEGNEVSGTSSFMAPEQYEGQQATQRTDIWAWGVVSYWLLAGRLPFEGQDSDEVRQKITSPSPPDDLSNAPGVPSHLASVVMRCLSKRLDGEGARYGSFREVIKAIKDAEYDENRPQFHHEKARDPNRESGPVFISHLKFREQLLEYIPNTDAESQLDEFVNDEHPFRWWGVIGPGGIGKSRLALELVQRLNAAGVWNAGFLTELNATHWLQHQAKNWQPKLPTLIIIDYSTRCAEALFDCLYTFSTDEWQKRMGEGARVRILMLDRPGSSFAPVSFEMQTDNNTANYDHKRLEARKHLFKPLRLYSVAPSEELANDSLAEFLAAFETETEFRLPPIVAVDELLSLPPWSQKDGGWRSSIERSIASVTSEAVSLPPDTDQVWWSRINRLTEGRPLFLQILGICIGRNPNYVQAITDGKDGLEKLLDDMLQYERTHHWLDLFEDNSITTTSEAFRSLEKAIGFITLARGVTWPTDKDALQHCAGILPNRIERIVSKILGNTESSTEDQRLIPPLEPDLLGERLLINLAKRSLDPPRNFGYPQPNEPIDTNLWIGHALNVDETKTCETIRMLVADFSNSDEIVWWLESLLRAAVAHIDVIEGCGSNAVQAGDIETRQADFGAFAALAFREYCLSREGFSNSESQELFFKLAGHSWPALCGALIAFFDEHHAVASLELAGKIRPIRDNLLAFTSEIDSQHTVESKRWMFWALTSAMMESSNNISAAEVEYWGGRLLKLHTTEIIEDVDFSARYFSRIFHRYLMQNTGNERSQMMEEVDYHGPINELTPIEAVDIHTQLNELFAVNALERILVNADSVTNYEAERDDIEDVARVLTQIEEVVGKPEWIDDTKIQQHSEMVIRLIENPAAVEHLESTLHKLALLPQISEDIVMQQYYAVITMNLSATLFQHQKVDEAERWAERIHELAQQSQWKENPEIQQHYAVAVAVANAHYTQDQKVDEAERWAERLWQLATQPHWQSNSEIQQRLAQAARNTVVLHQQTGNGESLERWGERIHELAQQSQWKENPEIQQYYAIAVAVANAYYAQNQKVDEAERWAERLWQLATQPHWQSNSEIQQRLAQAARDGVVLYQQTGNGESLERWGERIHELAQQSQWKENPEIQQHYAVAVAVANAYYAQNQKVDEAERWAERLWQLATQPHWQSNSEIQQRLAQAARNTVVLHQQTGNGESLERWGERIHELAQQSQWKENLEIQQYYAIAVAVANAYYAQNQKVDEAERWAERLWQLATQPHWQSNSEIQQRLAQAARDGVVLYQQTGNGESLERWGERIHELAQQSQWKENPEIQQHYAVAVAVANAYYAQNQKVDEAERWAERLWQLATQPHWQSNSEIQQRLAQAARNTVVLHQQSGNGESLERWGERIHELAQQSQWKENLEIQQYYAIAVAVANAYYAQNQKVDEAERWAERLWQLATQPHWQSNSEIQQRLAQAARDGVVLYQQTGNGESLERWGERIHELAQQSQWKENPEIQQHYAIAVAVANAYYAQDEKVDEAQQWAERFHELAQQPHWQSNSEIQQRLAQAARDAVVLHQQSGNGESLERWGERIHELAQQSQWIENPEIQQHYAVAAAVAKAHYTQNQMVDDAKRWAERLLELAQQSRWRNNVEIQQCLVSSEA